MLSKFLFGTLAAVQYGQAQQLLEEFSQNDAQPTCEEQPFCDRFRQFKDNSELRANSDVYYSMDKDSFTVNETDGVIEATLNLASLTDGSVAQSLDLTVNVYQNGILRILIEEPGVKRFRISQEDLPVVDDQLIPQDLTGLWHDYGDSGAIQFLNSEEGDEGWEVDFVFDRFRIHHVSKSGEEAGFRTMTFNENDTLYYETESATRMPHLYGSASSDIAELKQQISEITGRDVYR